MSRHLLGNLEDETPNVFVNNGCKKQGRGVVGLFLVAFFAFFMGGNVLGQTDYSGVYYIRNMQATNASWFLVPCMGGGYYQDNEDTPFLTTYQTNQDMNSLWRLEKEEIDGVNYYRIIHNATGLYVTYNEAVLDYSSNNALAPRLRMHLEAFDSPTDATLFYIQPHATNGKIAIRPKDGYDTVNNYYWWDISGGNKLNYWNDNYEGSLGLWYSISNPSYNWQLYNATATCATPVITYNENTETISISYPIAGDGTLSIYYTTDDTEPTTSSTQYTGAFSATGVKKVRAIAVKSGYDNSAEAVLYGPNQPYLFKTTDDPNVSYYMIPPVDDNATTDLNVTTSNVPNERMQWLLKPAALRVGVQYYYFLNAATGKYAYCSVNINQGNALVMKELGETGTESDRYMFRLIDYGTYLNIVPKSFARLIPNNTNKNCLRKANKTDHTNPIGIYQDDGDLSRWMTTALPDDPKSLWMLPSTIVSSTGDVKYLKLRSAPQSNSNNYYVCPPSTQAYATAAVSGDHPEWYLSPVDDSDPMCSFYYIRNAYTGHYLYFEGVAYNNNDNKFFTSETVMGDKSKFLVLRTANTDYSGSYHIVPKLIRNNNNQNQIALNRTNSTLKTIQSRNTNASCWFIDATTFTCDAPTFTYNDVQGTLSMASPNNAPIYYVAWNDGQNEPALANPADGTLYNGPIDVTYTHYKAIAARCTDGSDMSALTTFDLTTPFKCATPVIIYNTSTQLVSITSATNSATIYYTIDSEMPSNPINGGATQYNGPFTMTEPHIIRAVAIRGTEISTISDVAEYNDIPTYISYSSQITQMNGNYAANSNFTVNTQEPIGTAANPFQGKFDGAFVNISLDHPLFGYVNGATIKNVIISSATLSTNDNAGAIANNVAGDSRIYNCGLLAGTVSGSNYVGGLVGLLDGSSRVINCYSFANVTSANYGSGVVGYNNTSGATQENYSTKTIVMNCMFYGEITATTTSPVYGGNIIVNNTSTGINNYNYFLETATFDDAYSIGNNSNNIIKYKNSWPAEERFLTRFEYYRSILNSNRRLCTWWVNGTTGVAPTDEDVATVGIAKWVLDPSIAPYPILKPWGKYPSVINQDSNQVWDETSQEWKSRDNLPAYQGKKLGTLTVTVKAGSNNINATDKTLVLPVLDMDTLHSDYCYAKVQLPYYNEQFGNPDGTTHAEKYGNNYTDKIVTGWKINSVTGGTQGSFEPDWEQGYNFADRKCTDKDLYSVSGRVFAQGGYYYVPEGVTAITIEAYWGNAVYLHNEESYLDRVNFYSSTNGNTKYDKPFVPGGTLPTTFNEQPVYNNITTAISHLQKVSTGVNVYDQAVVLVSNYQYMNLGSQDKLGWGSGNFANNAKPFTWTCVDLDFDNEPDYCLELQYGHATTRVNIHPVRFDFIPIPDLGMALKRSSMPYGCGIFIPRGHFEITETAFMHTNQFEYDGHSAYPKETAPLILNGGQYEQFVTTVETSGEISNHTNYIIIGGHAWMKKFTPGSHVDEDSKPTRLCAVSVLGAEFQEFYLTGMFRADISDNVGNPHCYTNGGRFGLMAGAGMEQVNGDVTFKIDHSIVDEFYGGGINSDKPVTGNIHVTIDNSLVGYYCGGPKTGNMGTGTEVVTIATKSIFGKFFGGGNGGNNFTRNKQWDNTIDGGADTDLSPSDWDNTGHFTDFVPFTYVNAGVGYHAQFEFELMNNSGGDNNKVVARTYRWDAQFSMTEVQNVTSTLTDCHVKQEFYGGGNLSPVRGNVVSTLDNTRIDGSAFGAGFSATIPSFSVHDKTTVNYPSRDIAGICHPGSLEYQKDGDVVRLYTWIDTNGLQSLGVTSGVDENHPDYYSEALGKWYCYTGVELSNLGTVYGNTTLIIKGNSMIHGSVFGGGNESRVDQNTEVQIMDETKVEGDIYGGGNIGVVGGNTEVKFLGKTKVFGNIYGGGNMGLVGGNTQVIINGKYSVTGTGTNGGSTNH